MNLLQIFRNFTIRTRMLGAIAAVLSLLCLVGAGGFIGLTQLEREATSFVEGTHQDMLHLGELRNALGNVRRYEKDLIIQQGNPAEVTRYLAQWDKANEEAKRLANLLGARQDDQGSNDAKAIATLIDSYRKAARPLLSQGSAGVQDVAALDQSLKPAKVFMHDVEKRVPLLVEHLAAEAELSQKRRSNTAFQAYAMLAAAFAIAIVVVVPLTLVNMHSICRPIDDARHLAEQIAAGNLTSEGLDTSGRDEAAQLMGALANMQRSLRSIVGQVRASTDSITTASSEIAVGNQDLSSRTEETASNLEQTAASIEEISGTVRQSAESAQHANELAASAADVASRGGVVVSEVVSTMEDIHASSRKINDIIGVIDGIAFQTNILALNAAVEAARAGEQGRGFAVVASEVRSLAQRSAEAAREIKALIGASVDKVENGSRLVADAGSTMSEIVASVQRVSSIMSEISNAATQQSAGVGEVNSAVANLDRMTQQNAALVEQSAAAAESLRDQARQLAEVVSVFRMPATAA